MAKGMFRRNGRYSVRRVIPVDLQPLYGRRELVKSLGTADPKEARRKHTRIWLAFDEEFEAARASLVAGSAQPAANAPTRTQQPADEATLIGQAVERLRRQRQEASEVGTLDDWAHMRSLDLDYHQGVLDGRDEPSFSLVKHERARNVLKAVLQGDVRGLLGTLAQVPAPSASGTQPQSATGPTLDELIKRWAVHAERQPKTVDKAYRVAREFSETCGPLRVDGVTADHVQAYKEALLGAGSSPATGNNKLNILRALLRFARANRIISQDPCEGIRIEDKRAARAARLDYSKDDLAKVFGSSVYAADERPTGGAGEAAYWLPLLALYTGARLNELGQLRPKDVRLEQYIAADDAEQAAWVIRFVFDEADGLRLKNKSSERRVPVHRELERAGFLRFVEAARAKGQARLFPALKPDKFGTITAQWSKWYGRYLRNVCGVVDSRVTFHSFRHTFKDRARYSALAPDVQNELTGHETGDVGDAYGGLSYPLLPLIVGIERYRVPGFTPPAPPPDFR